MVSNARRDAGVTNVEEQMLRGIRGAIQVEQNTAEDILKASVILMRRLIEANSVRAENVAAVFFTVTSDLNASFPAEVRKHIGWSTVPFLCSQEIPVAGSMRNILRVLVLFETTLEQNEIRHQYLGAASALRPDLSSEKHLSPLSEGEVSTQGGSEK